MERQIIKYENRRLYDKEVAAYVTLGHVAARMRDGDTINCRDKKTGEDITPQVLFDALTHLQGTEPVFDQYMLASILKRPMRAAEAIRKALLELERPKV